MQELFFDAARLNFQIDTVRDEERYCDLLLDHIRRCCRLALPEDLARLERLRELAEALQRYLKKTRGTVEHICDNTEKLSEDIIETLEQIAREVARGL